MKTYRLTCPIIKQLFPFEIEAIDARGAVWEWARRLRAAKVGSSGEKHSVYVECNGMSELHEMILP